MEILIWKNGLVCAGGEPVYMERWCELSWRQVSGRKSFTQQYVELGRREVHGSDTRGRSVAPYGTDISRTEHRVMSEVSQFPP